jgi:hypothetical protein
LRPEQRQVTPEQGKKLGEELGCAWTEASARYDVNVSKAFELLIEEIEKSQNPNAQANGGKCIRCAADRVNQGVQRHLAMFCTLLRCFFHGCRRLKDLCPGFRALDMAKEEMMAVDCWIIG